MKKIFILLTLVSYFFLSSCSSNEDLNQMSEDSQVVKEFLGMNQFKKDVTPILKDLSEKASNYNTVNTKALESDNKTIDRSVQELIVYSRNMLQENGVDVDSMFIDKNDPRIAMAGLAMMDYQKTANQISTRSTIGGCVLEAIGVRNLFKSGVKRAAKQIAKLALEKAVPYVGWGLTIADFAMCMTD